MNESTVCLYIVSHPHIYELTRIERLSPLNQTVYTHKNVAQCQSYLLQVTRPKTALLETSKSIYLASLLTHNLCSNDNLEITIRYQK